MYNKDAKELKKYIPYGTKVTIVKGAYGPFGDGFRILKPGNIGSDVYAIQEKLRELGYYKGWCDGIYGEQMKVAIYAYEDDKGLARTYYLTETLYENLGFVPFE